MNTADDATPSERRWLGALCFAVSTAVSAVLVLQRVDGDVTPTLFPPAIVAIHVAGIAGYVAASRVVSAGRLGAALLGTGLGALAWAAFVVVARAGAVPAAATEPLASTPFWAAIPLGTLAGVVLQHFGRRGADGRGTSPGSRA